MLDYGKLVETVSLDRNSIFTSLSSKDKDVAMRLVERLDAMQINHWCMYQRNGKDTNIGGDDYRKTIRRALESCCVLVFLMSKNSLYSVEVKDELEQVMRMKTEDITRPYIKIFPIIVDDTAMDEIPKDVMKLAEIKKEIIVRRYNASSTEEELSLICEEIREQYVNAIFENIRRKAENVKKSQKFNELLNRCVRGKCTANTISDDIKGSTEVCTDSLRETHVLSNELIEYDCNTYSCMIIATNLLGNEVGKGLYKTFDPKKNGVKYYYYIPAEEEANRDAAFRKIKEFIAKTPESRKEVTRLIRSEFCARNKVDVFFQEFNGKTVDDLFEQYNIEDERDKEIFNEFFASDLAQNFFDYSALREVLGVPEEFIDWLRGETERYSYDAQIETSYEFIRFISEFVALLEKSRKTVNTVLLDALHVRVTYLERIKRLEDWQMGVATDVTAAESKKLVNFLLDYTADNKDGQGGKKFPRLAAWMQFYHDKSGKLTDIPAEVVSAACENLIAVPVHEDKLLHLCYSFAIFVEKTGLSGAWYSTGQGLVSGKDDSTVTTYNIDPGTDTMKELSDAFFYLLSLNPEAEKILEATGSELLKRKRGKRQ